MRKSPHHEALKSSFKQLVRDSSTSRMLDRRQRILDNILDIQIRPDLMQDCAHVPDSRVCDHDEFELGRGLEVVKFVLAGTVR